MMVRPSARSTLSVSGVQWTFLTFSPGLCSEEFMPFLKEILFIVQNQLLESSYFTSGETKVLFESDRLKPKLGRLAASIYVYVRRFTRIVASKVHPVPALSQNRGHTRSLSDSTGCSVDSTQAG